MPPIRRDVATLAIRRHTIFFVGFLRLCAAIPTTAIPTWPKSRPENGGFPPFRRQTLDPARCRRSAWPARPIARRELWQIAAPPMQNTPCMDEADETPPILFLGDGSTLIMARDLTHGKDLQQSLFFAFPPFPTRNRIRNHFSSIYQIFIIYVPWFHMIMPIEMRARMHMHTDRRRFRNRGTIPRNASFSGPFSHSHRSEPLEQPEQQPSTIYLFEI